MAAINRQLSSKVSGFPLIYVYVRNIEQYLNTETLTMTLKKNRWAIQPVATQALGLLGLSPCLR